MCLSRIHWARSADVRDAEIEHGEDQLLPREHAGQHRQHSLLRVARRDTLLDPTRAIAATIRYRNPATDVLNLVQLDLMRRWRATDAPSDDLRQALLLSVNAIAAAMQSTG